MCDECNDHLISSYIFWQRIKVSDESYKRSLEALAISKSDEEEHIFEGEEHLSIESDHSTHKPNKKPKLARKRKKSPTKASQIENRIENTLPISFAVPQFIITSDLSDADPSAMLASCEEMQNLNDSSKIKTLTANTIISHNISEIEEICATAIEGEHDADSIYKCKYCPKAFAAPYHLMIHTRKSHMCQYCLATFIKTMELSKHIKEEHHSFDCLLCDRKFRTNGNLRHHLRKFHSVFLPAHVTLMDANCIPTK